MQSMNNRCSIKAVGTVIANIIIRLKYYENFMSETTLEVIEDSGVESLFSDSENIIDIYSPTGILIKRKANSEDLKFLEKGIYILKSKDKSYKININ